MKPYLKHWIISPKINDTSYYNIHNILKSGHNVYVLGGYKLDALNFCHDDYIFHECSQRRKCLTGRKLEFKELKRIHKLSKI